MLIFFYLNLFSTAFFPVGIWLRKYKNTIFICESRLHEISREVTIASAFVGSSGLVVIKNIACYTEALPDIRVTGDIRDMSGIAN